MIDDILIYGRNQEEHDKRLSDVLNKLQQAGVTLNKEKCKFSTSCVQFLGQQIDSQGIRPDPEKVTAIQQMAQPTNVKELQRFLGMTNHLSKFTPNLARVSVTCWLRKTVGHGESPNRQHLRRLSSS